MATVTVSGTTFEVQVYATAVREWHTIDAGFDTVREALNWMADYRKSPALAGIQYRVVRTRYQECKGCHNLAAHAGFDLCGSCYQDQLCDKMQDDIDNAPDDHEGHYPEYSEYDPEAFLDEEIMMGLR